MPTVIKKIHAFREYDSRGNETLAGVMTLSDGRAVSTSVPNNLSVNKYEALYLEPERAAKYINELIAPKLVGADPLKHKNIDLWLLKTDPTEKKEVLGANTILLLSKLTYQAAALLNNLPLYRFLNKAYIENFGKTDIRRMPSPIFNMISGGRHGSSLLNFQEFSVIFSSGLNYRQAMEQASELYHELERVFQYRNIFSGVGVDGAYVPNLSSNMDALEILKEAILKKNLKIGLDVFFALDVAASSLYKAGKYYLSEEAGSFDTAHLMEYYENLFKEYRFLVLEDPFAEDDFTGWQTAVGRLGEKVDILGDDLLSMSKQRLEKAVKDRLCSTADIKISQRGTLWEVFEFVSGARKGNMKIMLSQSAIETNDSFIADLSVALQADFVKFGAPARGERVAKHNRLLEIEREIFNG